MKKFKIFALCLMVLFVFVELSPATSLSKFQRALIDLRESGNEALGSEKPCECDLDKAAKTLRALSRRKAMAKAELEHILKVIQNKWQQVRYQARQQAKGLKADSVFDVAAQNVLSTAFEASMDYIDKTGSVGRGGVSELGSLGTAGRKITGKGGAITSGIADAYGSESAKNYKNALPALGDLDQLYADMVKWRKLANRFDKEQKKFWNKLLENSDCLEKLSPEGSSISKDDISKLKKDKSIDDYEGDLDSKYRKARKEAKTTFKKGMNATESPGNPEKALKALDKLKDMRDMANRKAAELDDAQLDTIKNLSSLNKDLMKQLTGKGSVPDSTVYNVLTTGASFVPGIGTVAGTGVAIGEGLVNVADSLIKHAGAGNIKESLKQVRKHLKENSKNLKNWRDFTNQISRWEEKLWDALIDSDKLKFECPEDKSEKETPPSDADTPELIKGKVTDESTGEAVPGGEIALRQPGKSKDSPKKAEIKEDGTFELGKLDPGEYELILKGDCHQKIKKIIEVGEGKDSVNIRAQKKPQKFSQYVTNPGNLGRKEMKEKIKDSAREIIPDISEIEPSKIGRLDPRRIKVMYSPDPHKAGGRDEVKTEIVDLNLSGSSSTSKSEYTRVELWEVFVYPVNRGPAMNETQENTAAGKLGDVLCSDGFSPDDYSRPEKPKKGKPNGEDQPKKPKKGEPGKDDQPKKPKKDKPEEDEPGDEDPEDDDPGEIIWLEPVKPREGQVSPPNDPFYNSKGTWEQSGSDQWALRTVGLKPDSGEKSIWQMIDKASEQVTVAFIDSGLDVDHPDIGNIWLNKDEIPDNNVDDDDNGYTDDVHGWNFRDSDNDLTDRNGHGTITAGIAGARTNNGLGIAGMNDNIVIMPLKVLDFDLMGDSSDISEAIFYAVDNGADVINISIGGEKMSRSEKLAVEYAYSQDVLIVVAAGNEGLESEHFYPAGLNEVITVSSVGPDLKRRNFSNWGAQVDIAAPGVDILSLRAGGTDLLLIYEKEDYYPGKAFVGEHNNYYRVGGTSFSAPFVTGTASLILSKNPEYTSQQIKRMILHSARDVEVPGKDQFTGYGLLDTKKALQADPEYYVESVLKGVKAVRKDGKVVLRVLGTSDANEFKKARIEIGKGEKPDRWKKIPGKIKNPVKEGSLMDIPARHFRGASQWTIKLITIHDKGTKREARYNLTLK